VLGVPLLVHGSGCMTRGVCLGVCTFLRLDFGGELGGCDLLRLDLGGVLGVCDLFEAGTCVCNGFWRLDTCVCKSLQKLCDHPVRSQTRLKNLYSRLQLVT
jgi:hypothetical protein